MSTKELSRRQLLGLTSVGAAIGMGLVGAYGEAQSSAPQHEEDTASAEGLARSPKTDAAPVTPWQYVKLDSATVAQEAYRLMAQGGCMYGLFGSIVGAMTQQVGEPYAFVPTPHDEVW